MKRNLLTQIKNEWRDNIWMILELTVVVGVIWIICAFFYMTVKDYFLPRGFDYENVFTLNSNSVSESSPYYVAPSAEETESYQHDLAELVRRLSENPNVESVAIESNGVPYNYSFYGTGLYLFDERDTIGYFNNARFGTPEIVSALGLESVNGKTRQELEDILRRGDLLVSANNQPFEEAGQDVMKLVGAKMIIGSDSTHVYRVGDVINKVRRNDFENTWGGTIIVPMTEGNAWGNLVVRLLPGHEASFKEDFRTKPELRKQRNVYLSDLMKLSATRESCQRQFETTLNTLLCLVLFLLATVFLGLLGTFWFRMQQRMGEIALRKVCGATAADIFRRVIGEGMILLALAVILISAIVWPLSKIIIGAIYCTRMELFVFELVGIALVALGIVLSLWYPARKAMNIEPAIALKSE